MLRCHYNCYHTYDEKQLVNELSSKYYCDTLGWPTSIIGTLRLVAVNLSTTHGKHGVENGTEREREAFTVFEFDLPTVNMVLNIAPKVTTQPQKVSL